MTNLKNSAMSNKLKAAQNRADLHGYVRRTMSYDPDTGHLTRANGSRAGGPMPSGYRSLSVLKKKTTEHRWIWFYVYGEWPPHEIDHINGIRDDNRLCNLRLATRSENGRNIPVKSCSKTGIKGIYQNGSGFSARIRHDGRRIPLGTYRTMEEAKAAYDAAALTLHGNFARLE